MKLSIISFTEKGIQLSQKLVDKLQNTELEIMLFSKCSYGAKSNITESIADWTKLQMQEKNALLFIGACGIAVRAIAPSILDKLQDSPVLVLDENGKHIIPILSGHMGGANELACLIAKKIAAVPVITTATDLNRKFAVDLFAKKNHLHIVNKEGIAKVSAKVLAGEEIVMSIESGLLSKNEEVPEGLRIVEYPPNESVDILIMSQYEAEVIGYGNIKEMAAIVLCPKEYVIGMGCRKGKEAEKIEKFISRSIEAAGILPSQIYALASIEQKREEEGLLAWSRKERVPFVTYTAEELQEVSGRFDTSDFVKKTGGVGNVCERAALKACGNGGQLICGKTALDGMTIAIAKREWSVTFKQESVNQERI